MIVFEEQKALFIAVPKTGCTSIYHAFKAPSSEPIDYHKTYVRAIIERPELESFSSFAFVRNPWDRLVSLYHDFRFNRVNQYSEKIRVDKPLLSEYSDFEDFVIGLPYSKYYYDVHFRPQIEFLRTHYYGIDGGVEYILQFESLETNFNFIVNKLGLPQVSLGHDRKSNRSRSYTDYYNSHTRAVVENLYSEDITYLGYKFNE